MYSHSLLGNLLTYAAIAAAVQRHVYPSWMF